MSDAHPLAEKLTALLVQLIRAALPADDAARAEPRGEALRLHGEIRSLLRTEDLVGINLDGLWSRAAAQAEDPGLDQLALEVSNQLPAVPPLSLGDLVGPSLALADIEEKIRLSAATG
jgi:hypothetical protein